MAASITVHARKVTKNRVVTYTSFISVKQDGRTLYTKYTGIYRSNKTDALHDAADLREDFLTIN